MANKYLTLTGLKAAVAKSEAKDLVDSPLGKALQLYEVYHKDQMNAQRDDLDDVIEAVPAAKKNASADRALVKYLDEVLRAATTERKNLDTYLAKFGMRKVKLQIIMTNWDGAPMSNRQVWAVFKCPGAPDIALMRRQPKGDGIIEYNNVELPPSGSIFVNALPSNGASDYARGADTYDLPKKPLVRIKVKQEHEEIKKKEKSGLKAAEKAGKKGTVGINWKIFSAGKEITSEKEITKEHEEEVEYTIRVPKGSLVIGKME